MNLLATPRGRKLLFTALYLSEGAPIGFLWWALPTRLRTAGVPVEEITVLTSMLVLPWVFKFVWAPLIDALQSERWSLRAWIISMQLIMGLALLPLLFFDLHEFFPLFVILFLIHAVAAATQDVSVDALAIRSVPAHERGGMNGWMQAGMLTGRSALGGGALLLGGILGDTAVSAVLILVIWASTVLLLFSKVEFGEGGAKGGLLSAWDRFREKMRAAAKRRSTWLGLLFAGIAGAGFEAVGAVAGPFLIDRGFSSEEVGVFFAGPVIIGMIGGALLGGHISDRVGRRRAVGFFLILMTCVIGLLAITDATAGEELRWLRYLWLVVLYLCVGLFTASSYALFMDLTHPGLGATQFSAYMGATNGCEAWAAFAVGRITAATGYAAAFAMLGGISLLALPLLRAMRREERA